MDTLAVKMQTIDDKTMFSAVTRENPEIVIDFFPPAGTGKGYTSLELLMVSLGTCVSTTLISFLRFKMDKSINGVSAEMNGTVCEKHPKKLNKISLFLKVIAEDLTEDELQDALKVVENKICPVWAMIKGNVTVDVKTEICLPK
ncbi:MAG: OsmC family protein [Treponema sp.]|nr:OsmC family protein [Treponema sp.]